jgi:PKD repeat protein
MKTKNIFLNKIFLSLIFIYVFLGVEATNWVNIKSNEKKTKISLISSNETATVINFSVNSYKLKEVTTDRGIAYIISAYKSSQILKKGAPDLSKLTTSIIIPDHKTTQISVLSSSFIEIQNINIAPSKGVLKRNINPADVTYEYGVEYEQNQFYPSAIASLSTPYIARDFRGQAVVVYPFQYNPVTKVLRIYTNIKVKISSAATVGINEINRTKASYKINSEFRNVYKRHFLNYSSSITRYTSLDDSPGSMLIICYDSFTDEMADFVTWKNMKGIPTEIVGTSTVGTSSSAIATYVANYYSSNTDFTYLLLVGDAAQVPPSYSSGDSDNDYGYLAGSDHYLDIFVGRFSAETSADVTTQVNRTIHYERDMSISDTWLSKGVGIASNEGGTGGDDGESDEQHINNIETDLEGYGYSIDRVYQDGGSASQLTTLLNQGKGIINYCGHGDVQMWASMVYTNTNVNALTNDNKLPFIFSVACLVGDFNGNTCFAEAWLRATNSGQPTGAIAFNGSTINQSWASPMCAQDEMDDILVESSTGHIRRTYGGIGVNGLFQMIDEYGSDGEDMADTWTIFGDPSVMVRTTTPQTMTVTHNPTVNVGATQFTVNCNVNDALVALSINGQMIGRGYSNGTSATISFNALTSTGTMDVTATAFNYVTYQGTVNIIAGSQPVLGLSYNNITGDDNSDGDFDPDETANVNITASNTGTAASGNSNVTCTATGVNSSYVTVNTPSVNVGVLNQGANVLVAFSITISPSIPLETEIELTFDLSDGTYSDQLVKQFIVGQDTTGYFTLDFEGCADWTLTFDPWTINDVNDTVTYSSSDYDFTHEGEAMAFMAFNPSQTTPSAVGDWDAHGGERFGACFNITGGTQTNHWLISPKITLGDSSSITLWVRTAKPGTWGNENYNICVSATDNIPSSFTVISGGTPEEAPTVWTERTYDLSAYDNQQVYIGIQCVSNNKFLFMIDDISINFNNLTPPVANFIADNTIVCENNNVLFTDISTNSPTSLEWTFNGGTPSTSNNQNPTVTYSNTGTYDVSLIAHNADGSDTETKSGYITVETKPVPGFTYITNDYDADFTNTSTNASSYFWDFDDGDTSIVQNPHNTYSNQGLYNVALTASNSCGDSTKVQQINIIVTSVSNNVYTKNFEIYPNPTSGLFTINTNNKITKIEIIDLLGRILFVKNNPDNIINLDLSEFNKGLYFVKFYSDSEVSSYKLILNK